MGFTLNPYDLCVANKIFNGSQCSVVFYVNDNKISHKVSSVVDNVVKELKSYFGDLTIQKVRKLNYLGMNIHIREDIGKLL